MFKSIYNYCYTKTSNNWNKRGAMFGLDARIALAIFGALSVITGAALYKAIGDAKVIATITEMTELGKAFEQYYLDTGVYPSAVGAGGAASQTRDAQELISSTAKDWKGPYINGYETVSYGTGKVLNHPKFLNIYYIFINDKNTWGDSTVWHTDSKGFCVANEPCYLWVMINKIPLELMQKMDKHVDGAISPTTGNFRWSNTTSNAKDAMLKIMPVQFP